MILIICMPLFVSCHRGCSHQYTAITPAFQMAKVTGLPKDHWFGAPMTRFAQESKNMTTCGLAEPALAQLAANKIARLGLHCRCIYSIRAITGEQRKQLEVLKTTWRCTYICGRTDLPASAGTISEVRYRCTKLSLHLIGLLWNTGV